MHIKEMIIEIASSHFFWIATELLIVAILVFLISKNSKRKKAIKEDLEQNLRANQYKELDEMLVNKKRGRR